MKKASILIVDDEPDNFDVIETLLSIATNQNSTLAENRDYQLHYAANGEEAITFLQTLQPDLILLDVMMPIMNGIEVCRRIKANSQWRYIPIVMVTALNTKSDLASCLNAGADDFIAKPINGLELSARVHSMLRIKQQYDDIQTLSNAQTTTIDFLKNTLNELRGNFASSVSHELNTPLNGILSPMELLRDEIVGMNLNTPAISEMLDSAQISAHRLEKLTKKLLVYLELELSASKQQPIESFSTLFLSSEIEALGKSHAQKVNRTHDIIFSLESAEIAISQRYLSIIIDELVNNALKFSLPNTTIKVSSQIMEEMLHLSVHDFGRGMTEEQIAKIDAFMQFERKTYEQQGIGIGLKIVKKIVELVGGKFSINSVYLQQTTVNLTLPIVRSSRERQGAVAMEKIA